MKIIDDEEYEKNKNFFLELAEPRMVDMSLQKGAVLNLFLSLLSLSLSLALTRCQCLFLSVFVASVSPQASLSLLCPLPLPELFTLLYLLHGTGAYSPPASFYFYTSAHPRTLYLILHLELQKNQNHKHAIPS